MPSTQPTVHESDSEDDLDYVPHADADSESSDEETETNDVKVVEPQLTEEEEMAKKKAREALWVDFQASVSAPPPPSELVEPPPKMVKIEKRYLFAGKEVIEVIEVAENSLDAKRWPAWRPPTQEDVKTPISTSISGDLSELKNEVSTSTLAASETPSKPKQPPSKRPGPRKPKTLLPGIPTSQKPKKLTTLDKSAMDWSAHINAEQDSGMKDQLEANRRGGGYLEKVEFLQRVGERKDDVLEANKSNKRRRL